jgi:hypothetical protein
VYCNTYTAHPWPGWSDQSFDVWAEDGGGVPVPQDIGYRARRFLMDLEGSPYIRHTIYLHQLWTSWSGYSYWNAEDHIGSRRHVHVTYY